MNGQSGSIFTEWMVIPFSKGSMSVGFNNTYKTKPSVFVQVYGDENAKVKVSLNSHDQSGVEVYSGLSMWGIGDGTDVAIQVIGRV